MQSVARDLLLLKKSELEVLEDLGKTVSDKRKKSVKSEAAKLTLEKYNKAQDLLTEVESLALKAQECSESIEANSKEMQGLLERGEIHSKSRKTIEENCKVSVLFFK